MFAHELHVELELIPVYELMDLDPLRYGENPALKMPVLRRDGGTLFGAENICRALADGADGSLRIVWPEMLRDDRSRNAQEMIWHCMAAQVQLVLGTGIGKLPADHVYFAKARAGLDGALGWLEAHAAATIRALPPRDLSLLEVTLFCLIEHLIFRPTVPLDPYPSLVQLTRDFSTRPSAQATSFAFDRRTHG